MAQEESAYDRLQIVMGEAALQKIKGACVMVLGLGGVGSNCVEALVRGGVGKLILLDRDVVAPSNINRQAVAFSTTIGKEKTQVMADIAKAINPEVELTLLQTFLATDTVSEILDQALADAGNIDYVVDAIDTVSQKLLVAQWAQSRGVRLISSMGGANKLNPERLRIAKIEDTISCPLCKIMRKECKKRHIYGLEVLYSSEIPVAAHPNAEDIPADGSRPKKGVVLGTMSYIPPIMGMMIAGHVIRQIAGLVNENDITDPADSLSKRKRNKRGKGKTTQA